jgi:hypothetical protein
MLEFSVNGIEPGQTIHLHRAATLRVKGKAWAQHPLDKLEVIFNGKLGLTGAVGQDRLSAEIDADLPIRTSGWIALRVAGPGVAYWVGSTLTAHTSPIYVEVEGNPIDAAEDARFFLAWIDRLEAAVRKRNRVPVGMDHVEMQISAARSVYQKIIQRRTGGGG